MEPNCFIDIEKLTRRRLEVKVLRVESPLLFWVRLKTGEKNLRELLGELQFHMSRRARFLSCWPDQIQEEEAIAIKEGGRWQRGLITRVNREKGRALVSLADWGQVTWRPFRDLYFLEERFMRLPWQAIACGLAHIAPPTPSKLWSSKTQALCRILAEGEEGWIQIKYPLWLGAALVELTIIGPKDDSKIFTKTTNLREALLRLGHVKEEKKITIDTFPAV